MTDLEVSAQMALLQSVLERTLPHVEQADPKLWGELVTGIALVSIVGRDAYKRHQGASAEAEPRPADCVLSTDDGGRVPLSDLAREESPQTRSHGASIGPSMERP